MENYIVNKITNLVNFHILGNRICKLIIILLFIYQSIDLTISYYKYETLINVKFEAMLHKSPAITICSDKNFGKFDEINLFRTIGNYMNQTFKCSVLIGDSYLQCHQISQPVISIITNGNPCLTFLSQLIQNSFISNVHKVYITHYNNQFIYNKNMYFYIHRGNLPPFLLHEYFKLNFGFISIRTKILNHNLLPFPPSNRLSIL